MKKVAFVLNGCGALGAYQANALNQLAAQGVKPNLLVGVSSGAINCFGYAAVGPSRLFNFWTRLNKMSDCFGFNYLNLLLSTGAYSTDPLIDKVKRECYDTYSTKIDTIFPYIDAFTGEIFVEKYVAGTRLTNIYPDLKKAIAIPGVIKAEENGRYIDAGARLLCPLKEAIKEGVDEIYIILGKPLDVCPGFDGRGLLAKGSLFKIASYAYRFNDLLMYEIFKRDIKECLEKNLDSVYGVKKKRFIDIYLVEPEKDLGGSLDFTLTQSRLKEKVSIKKLS